MFSIYKLSYYNYLLRAEKNFLFNKIDFATV